MPQKLTIYIPDDTALADLEAFRTLAARRGQSVSQALRRLMHREVQAAGRLRTPAKTVQP